MSVSIIMPEPTTQLAILLLVVGLFVLVLELFLPSGGMLFVIAMVAIVSSVVVGFFVSPYVGSTLLGIDIVLAIILPGIGIKIWQMTPMGRRMFLDAPGPVESTPAHSPVIISSEDGFQYAMLLDQIGRTETILRPAGTTDFDGRRIDTVSEGVMIERGEWVRVVAVEGRRVVVRRIDPPLADEDLLD